MSHYQKSEYPLNKSHSKSVQISLLRKGDAFTPSLQIYGDKDSVKFTLRQYLELFTANPDIFAFFDGLTETVFLDLTNENTQIFVTAKKLASCSMLVFKQIEDGHISVVCIARNTYEKLLDLRPIIHRLLLRFEKSMPDIMDTYKKVGSKDWQNIIGDKINVYGFDITAFAYEVMLYSENT